MSRYAMRNPEASYAEWGDAAARALEDASIRCQRQLSNLSAPIDWREVQLDDLRTFDVPDGTDDDWWAWACENGPKE
jgi:hypothetical protein